MFDKKRLGASLTFVDKLKFTCALKIKQGNFRLSRKIIILNISEFESFKIL